MHMKMHQYTCASFNTIFEQFKKRRVAGIELATFGLWQMVVIKSAKNVVRRSQLYYLFPILFYSTTYTESSHLQH